MNITTENRAQAFDATRPHQTPGAKDHLLLEIDADARHRDWIICESVCLWTGGVKMAISTFETLPDEGNALKDQGNWGGLTALPQNSMESGSSQSQ